MGRTYSCLSMMDSRTLARAYKRPHLAFAAFLAISTRFSGEILARSRLTALYPTKFTDGHRNGVFLAGGLVASGLIYDALSQCVRVHAPIVCFTMIPVQPLYISK